MIEGLDSTNTYHALSLFQQDGHEVRLKCFFSLVDLAGDALHAIDTPSI